MSHQPNSIADSAAAPVGASDDTTSSRLGAFAHAVTAAWALLVGMALLMIGSGLQGSLLGLRASLEGFGTATTGVVMSSYYLGYLLGSTRAVHLVATVGHIRVFTAFASVASAAVLIHALVLEPAGWVVLRIASGFCMAGLFVVAESWLNDTATNETRGSLMSLYMVVVSGGMGLGQVLLNVSPPDGFQLFVLTSVLMSLGVVPAALSVRAAPRMLVPTPVTMGAVFRAAPLGVIGVMCAGAASGALFGMGVVYAQLVGLSLAKTSAFMLAAILVGAVLQWPIGILSDHTDRRRVISATALLAAGAALFGATGPHGLTLLITIGAVGGFSLPLYALLNAHTNDFIDAEQMVGAGGRLVLASGLGAITGPFAASLAMGLVGAEGFFWFLAATHLVIALYAAWRLTRRAPVAAEDRSHFAAIPARGGSVLVTALNPEAWDDDDQPVFATQEVPVVSADG